MHVYLIRHGDAVAKDVDRTRPLTEAGRATTTQVAAWFGRVATVRAPHVLSSDKLRAEQTAQVIAAEFRGAKLEHAPDLYPDEDPAPWLKRLARATHDVILVGHCPNLERLASLLLTGAADGSVLSLQKSGIACFARLDTGGWSLLWLVQPAQIV